MHFLASLAEIQSPLRLFPPLLPSLLHLKLNRRNWTWTMQILPSLLLNSPYKTSVYLLPFLLRQVECFVFIIITVRCGILMRLLCAPPTSESQTPRYAPSFSLSLSLSVCLGLCLSFTVALIFYRFEVSLQNFSCH